MPSDLTDIDKFIKRVEVLREAKVKEATFDVAFLGRVIDQLAKPQPKTNQAKSISAIYSGGNFKQD